MRPDRWAVGVQVAQQRRALHRRAWSQRRNVSEARRQGQRGASRSLSACVWGCRSAALVQRVSGDGTLRRGAALYVGACCIGRVGRGCGRCGCQQRPISRIRSAAPPQRRAARRHQRRALERTCHRPQPAQADRRRAAWWYAPVRHARFFPCIGHRAALEQRSWSGDARVAELARARESGRKAARDALDRRRQGGPSVAAARNRCPIGRGGAGRGSRRGELWCRVRSRCRWLSRVARPCAQPLDGRQGYVWRSASSGGPDTHQRGALKRRFRPSGCTGVGCRQCSNPCVIRQAAERVGGQRRCGYPPRQHWPAGINARPRGKAVAKQRRIRLQRIGRVSQAGDQRQRHTRAGGAQGEAARDPAGPGRRALEQARCRVQRRGRGQARRDPPRQRRRWGRVAHQTERAGRARSARVPGRGSRILVVRVARHRIVSALPTSSPSP